MATEADKTHSGVIATTFAVGAAVMVAGTAAIVALARTEMDNFGRDNHVYADLETVARLKQEQEQQLRTAKIPIDQAKRDVLAAIKQDPRAASPAAPAAEPEAAGPADEAADTATGTPENPQAEQPDAAGERDKSAQTESADDKPLEAPSNGTNTAGEAQSPSPAPPAEGGQQ